MENAANRRGKVLGKTTCERSNVTDDDKDAEEKRLPYELTAACAPRWLSTTMTRPALRLTCSISMLPLFADAASTRKVKASARGTWTSWIRIEL